MRKEKVQFILCIFIMSLVIIPIYIILHESGHAVIALLCGAKNIRISIFPAYATWDNFEVTPFRISLMNIFGMLFPVIIFSMIIGIFFNKNKTSIPYLCCFFTISVITIFPILAWIIVPIVGMVNELPSGDDVTNFIYNSGWHPGTVIVFALVLFILALAIIVLKGLPKSVVLLIKEINDK